jgi:hypothetical protein
VPIGSKTDCFGEDELLSSDQWCPANSPPITGGGIMMILDARVDLRAVFDREPWISTPGRFRGFRRRHMFASLLKLVEPADVAEALRLHKEAMMFSGFWSFSGVVPMDQARVDVFELQSVG